MIWTFIKKNFFDGWENIGNVIVANLLQIPFIGLIVLVLVKKEFKGPLTFFEIINESEVDGPFYFFQTDLTKDYLTNFDIIKAAIIFLSVFLAVVFAAAYAKSAFSISNYESVKAGDYFKNIGWAFKETAGLGLVIACIVMSFIVGIPVYLYQYFHLGQMYGLILAGILFCFLVTMLLALQWFVALKVNFGFDFKKTFSKCFVILFDNFGFSVFMAFYSAVFFALSCLLLFFMPGLCGINLGYINALKLRLYKYDWLDQHKDLKNAKDRKNVPWDALLKEDKDILSKKSLKTMLMPWKDKNED